MKRRTSRFSLSLCFALAVTSGAHVASAQATNVDAAKRLFDAGAQAYASGQFTAAIQAFEQAIAILPKAAILFSLAQAQRRQYIIDKSPALLAASMKNFRAYLEQEPQGGRRVDAAQALSELEMLGSRTGEAGPSKPAIKEPARLMVMSRTPGAVVSIDGKDPKAVPLGVEVGPGKHRVFVSAPGYFEEEREPVAVDNAIVPVDVDLRERPAVLVVAGQRGAEIAVDGRVMGEIGKTDPIEVPAGTRFVTVSKNGRQPYAQDVELRRGEHKQLEVPLRVTQQRILSYGFIGAAGVSAVLSGAFGLSALGHESEAEKIERIRQEKTITSSELRVYSHEVDARDRDVTRAAVALGVAAGIGAVGAALWFFDQPNVPPAPRRREPSAAPRAPPREPTEIGVGPGPGVLGAAVHGRF